MIRCESLRYGDKRAGDGIFQQRTEGNVSWLERRKFLALLLSLGLLLVVHPLVRGLFDERLLYDTVLTVVFLAALLVALVFGHLYCVIQAITPGSFHARETFAAELQDETLRHSLLTYFSVVTLTTVGYGDITPVGGAARGLVAVEAVAGQFYIAVLVAELIGKRVSQAIMAGQQSNSTG